MGMPILYGIGTLYGNYLRYLSWDAKEQDGACTGRVSEVFGNIRVVRSFAAEGLEVETFSAALNRARDASVALGCHIGVFQGTSTNIRLHRINLISGDRFDEFQYWWYGIASFVFWRWYGCAS
jgi:ATP-binding cassette subfamily B (MDR/TAP) protein 8